jgi:hypothetical protein
MRDWFFRAMRASVTVALIAILVSLYWGGDGWGGRLEDLLLENKQITIDQWVQLKAEEEKREAKAFEQSRSVSEATLNSAIITRRATIS